MLKLEKIVDNITPDLKSITKELQNLPQEAFQVWRDVTPVKTGNARRKTTLRGNEINANYDYAVPLDQGRSKQAPKGMAKPTEQYIRRRLSKILGA